MFSFFSSPRAFRMIGIMTIAAVYFLILVGGIVRASGAGMGCPDWPKCFDQWIPPTDVSQLPANYQDIYHDRGYADTTFNPVKTWTEYVNRLVGVTIGFLIFLTLLSSASYFKTDRTVTVLSFVALILVGFQGWLGSYVVKTNLVPFVITLHMVVALILVSLLIYTIMRAQYETYRIHRAERRPILGVIFACVLVLSLAQIILGTQVREQIDQIASVLGEIDRTKWASKLTLGFYVHRTFSIVVLSANVALAFELLNRPSPWNLRKGAIVLVAILLAEIACGASLYYLGMPAYLQPAHLLLANLVFGTQFYLWMAYRYASQFTDGAKPLPSALAIPDL